MVMRGDRLAKGSWKMYCMRCALAAQLGRAELGDVDAVEADRARVGSTRRRTERPIVRLAAAGFADQADDLAALHLEGDVLQGLDHGPARKSAGREMLGRLRTARKGSAMVTAPPSAGNGSPASA